MAPEHESRIAGHVNPTNMITYPYRGACNNIRGFDREQRRCNCYLDIISGVKSASGLATDVLNSLPFVITNILVILERKKNRNNSNYYLYQAIWRSNKSVYLILSGKVPGCKQYYKNIVRSLFQNGCQRGEIAISLIFVMCTE